MIAQAVAAVLSLSAAAAPQAAPCDAPLHECATALIERGAYGAAIETLQFALADAPRDLKALNLLGIALTGAGRIEDANVRFRQALAVDAGFQPARKNLAVNEFNAGRHERARRLFEEVIAATPGDEVAHVHLGEIAYARKESAAALSHYEKSGARVMATPLWMLHYATCLLDAGQVARSVTVIDLLPPDDSARRFEAAVALGRAGVYKEAARLFGTARAGRHDPYEVGYNQTLMLVEAGDYETAIGVAEDLLKQDVRTADLYSLVSRAYVAAGRIQDAYDALRSATTLEPEEAQHYTDLALICLDHENYDLGIEIVDIGLQYRPDAAALRLYRGVLLVMKGAVDQAEADFDRARALVPENPAPAVALAMAWMQSGRTPRAVELLRQEARRSRAAIVPYLLGVALVRSGVDPSDAGGAEASQAFERAVDLDPTLAGPRAELGKMLLKQGHLERAVGHLERAVQLDSDNVAATYSLAQAYRQQGRLDRAQELLARVAALNAVQRGDDPERELKRMVVRIVREGWSDSAGRPRSTIDPVSGRTRFPHEEP